MKIRLGVIIGRFQVPLLHDAHKGLINYVIDRNEEVVIIIGKSVLKTSVNSPLPIVSVIHSVRYSYLGVPIAVIEDCKSDAVWSGNLDSTIISNYPEEKYDICLYGSRDSFIKSYSGRFRCEEIPAINCPPATLIRKGIGKFVEDSVDFRKGIIYASQNMFPISYQCVDIIMNNSKREILLGRKKGGTKYVFPGGFVDPTDESLEDAALRELKEEVGDVRILGLSYKGSFRVNDWRYKKEPHKIMSAVFTCGYFSGAIKASDDLESVDWVSFKDINEDTLSSEHWTIFKKLYKNE